MDWTSERLKRYARQVNLTDFDLAGQERLYRAHVLVVGVGGLGCAVTQYLASSGVGKISIIDPDRVDITNMHRQLLYRNCDVGQSKAMVAARRLKEINPDIQVFPYSSSITTDWFAAQAQTLDVVIDATDNLSSRKLIHLQCRQHQIPLVMGAAIRLEGQLAVFTHQANAPCYQCLTHLFGEAELSCVEAGVMPAVVGVIGNLQALEAIKLILGWPTLAPGQLLLFDGRGMEFRKLMFNQFDNCPVCRVR